MKIKIDENGDLCVERKGRFIVAHCPFAYDSVCCGHWCPLFGEPEEYYRHRWTGTETIKYCAGHTLTLCHGTVLKGELVDERG